MPGGGVGFVAGGVWGRAGMAIPASNNVATMYESFVFMVPSVLWLLRWVELFLNTRREWLTFFALPGKSVALQGPFRSNFERAGEHDWEAHRRHRPRGRPWAGRDRPDFPPLLSGHRRTPGRGVDARWRLPQGPQRARLRSPVGCRRLPAAPVTAV